MTVSHRTHRWLCKQTGDMRKDTDLFSSLVYIIILCLKNHIINNK